MTVQNVRFKFDFYTIQRVLDHEERNNILGLFQALDKYWSIAEELPHNLLYNFPSLKILRNVIPSNANITLPLRNDLILPLLISNNLLALLTTPLLLFKLVRLLKG